MVGPSIVFQRVVVADTYNIILSMIYLLWFIFTSHDLSSHLLETPNPSWNFGPPQIQQFPSNMKHFVAFFLGGKLGPVLRHTHLMTDMCWSDVECRSWSTTNIALKCTDMTSSLMLTTSPGFSRHRKVEFGEVGVENHFSDVHGRRSRAMAWLQFRQTRCLKWDFTLLGTITDIPPERHFGIDDFFLSPR